MGVCGSSRSRAARTPRLVTIMPKLPTMMVAAQYDECGVCGGEGIADGACDCDGNVLDECGVCGGNGIAEGACDCDGNVLDECGVCGGDGIADGACDCEGNGPETGYVARAIA